MEAQGGGGLEIDDETLRHQMTVKVCIFLRATSDDCEIDESQLPTGLRLLTSILEQSFFPLQS